MSLHTALIQTDEKKISPEEAKNLWQNKVSSIFVDDPSDYFNFLASPQY